MSGIAGLYFFDRKPVDSLTIQRIADSIAHRGPDGVNSLHLDGVALIHCLLKATPESLFERQPLKDSGSGITVIADARIDNRLELQKLIQIKNTIKGQIPDSLLILEAYKKWGQECPAHLIGDFAFALWDEQNRQLFCARDHIGARPFYYYQSDKFFAFSSEIKAILTLQDVPRTINDNRVADCLQLLVGNNTETFYKKIFRLEPATALIVAPTKFSTRRYWDYNHKYTVKRKNNDEYAQEFREIFIEAVRCRLRTLSPVGCTMSGGLDSSSVACAAGRIIKNSLLHTFSFNFPDLPESELAKIDERKYQQAVLASGDFIHHSINGHEFAPLQDLLVHLDCYDQPFFYPHLYLDWQAWKIAQENGIRVMLNGLDGDAVVSHGYEHLHHLVYHGKLFQFVKNIKEVSQEQGISKQLLMKLYLIHPLFKAPLAYIYHWVKTKTLPLWKVNTLLSGEFAVSSGLTRRINERKSLFQSAKKAHYQSLTNPLLTDVLELTNNFSSRFQIEVRSPFFDRRVMEFCYALPSEQKLQNGWSRFILRKAMQDVVPKKIVERMGKSNLSPGFIHTFLQNHSRLIQQMMASPHPYLSNKIKKDVLQHLYESLTREPYTCNRSYHLNIYFLVLLQEWLVLKNI